MKPEPDMKKLRRQLRYHERRAKGLCVQCGRVPATKPALSCDRCLERHLRANLRSGLTKKHWTPAPKGSGRAPSKWRGMF